MRVPFGPVSATSAGYVRRRVGAPGAATVPSTGATVDPSALAAIDAACRDNGSRWLGGLAVHIAEIGVDFEVLDPPELVERVKQLAGRFARATG
jgi:hypothetical protein